jgi:hypothetical protein
MHVQQFNGCFGSLTERGAPFVGMLPNPVMEPETAG